MIALGTMGLILAHMMKRDDPPPPAAPAPAAVTQPIDLSKWPFAPGVK